MPFNPGSHKTVKYDPQNLSFTTSKFWARTNVNAISGNKGDYDPSFSPIHLFNFFTSDDAFSLIIDEERECYISGFSPISKVTQGGFGGGQNSFYQFALFDGVRGVNFRKRGLSESERQFFRIIRGYPISFNVKLLSKGAFGVAPDGTPSNWSFGGERNENNYQNLDYKDNEIIAGSEFEVLAWVGGLTSDGQLAQLLNSDGTAFTWPQSVSMQSDGTFALSQQPELPAHIKAMPFSKSGSAAYSQLFLFQNSSSNSERYYNAVANIKALTMPGRVDTDGSVQGFKPELSGVEVGEIEISFRTFGQSESDFSKGQFSATVISSELQSIEVDDVSGRVIRQYRHILIISVPDRVKAGLTDIPRFSSKPEFPNFQIEGFNFFLSSITELEGKEVIMVLSSIAG